VARVSYDDAAPVISWLPRFELCARSPRSKTRSPSARSFAANAWRAARTQSAGRCLHHGHLTSSGWPPKAGPGLARQRRIKDGTHRPAFAGPGRPRARGQGDAAVPVRAAFVRQSPLGKRLRRGNTSPTLWAPARSGPAVTHAGALTDGPAGTHPHRLEDPMTGVAITFTPPAVGLRAPSDGYSLLVTRALPREA
jgi:hypothetical protein